MTKHERIFLSAPHMSGKELELVEEAFRTNWIAPLGPHVDGFEAEMCAYLGVEHATALSSGTAGLHLALLMLGVGPGDEVLCPTLTFAATANAITYVGATPVFVDSTSSSWNIDPALVREELDACKASGKLPKAMVSVDLYGQPCDYVALEALSAEFGVPLIEDAAEGLGATYDGKACGSFGVMAVLSFNGNKIITTGGGGMLLSHEERYTDRARFLATQARDPAPHYQHSTIGYNYRLSNVLAAIGRGQLAVLDERVDRRRAVNARYRELLGSVPGIELMPEAPKSRTTFWLTTLTIDPAAAGVDRETLRLALEAEDIEARPVWKPMHLQPVFAASRVRGGAVSERLFTHGLCLPSGSSLSDADVDRIAGVVLACVKGR